MEAPYDHQSLRQILKDGSNRGVVLSSDKMNSVLKASKGTFEYVELAERVISDHIVYWFTRNNFIFESFNRKVSQLVESGLARKYVNDFMKKYRKVSDRSNINDLIVKQMTFGIHILLLLAMLVTLSFIGEFAINMW